MHCGSRRCCSRRCSLLLLLVDLVKSSTSFLSSLKATLKVRIAPLTTSSTLLLILLPRCPLDSPTLENTEDTSRPVTVVSESTESIPVVEVLLVVSTITEPTSIRLVGSLRSKDSEEASVLGDEGERLDWGRGEFC